MNQKTRTLVDGFKGYDETLFLKACDIGLNAAVAFIVLCRGTGRDKSTTSWSANSVTTYGSMGRTNAQKAVASLLEHEIIRYGDKSTPAKPRYKVNVNRPDDDWVWMPNGVIDGLVDMNTGEYTRSPLAQLKRCGDVKYLKVFFFLYKYHLLDSDGGIARDLIYEEYKVDHLNKWVACDFYLYGQGKRVINENHPIFRELKMSVEEFIEVFEVLLYDFKFVELVDYVFESNSIESDLVYPIKGKESIDSIVVDEGESYWHRQDQRLVDSYEAGGNIPFLEVESEVIQEHIYRDRKNVQIAREKGATIVPVSVRIRNAHIFGIYRMTFRPHTSSTQAWYGIINDNIDDVIELLNI